MKTALLLSLLTRFIYTSNTDFSFLPYPPQVDGIDLNVVDVDYESPLHVASKNGHAAVVRLLLTRGGSGVDINIQTSDGSTPLYQAAAAGMFETVQVSVGPCDIEGMPFSCCCMCPSCSFSVDLALPSVYPRVPL